MAKKNKRGFSKIECKIWKITSVVVFIVFGIICMARIVGTEGVKMAGDEPTPGMDFTSFELISLDGEERITQEQLRDYDLTVVNFWETSCIFCIQEMPALNELSQESRYQGKVQFIGVCDDIQMDGSINEKNLKEAKSILKLRGQDFVQTMPSEETAKMTSNIVAYPQTYFLDSDGNILKVVNRAANKDQWRSIIDDLL